jgi:ZIP family zinc transporter
LQAWTKNLTTGLKMRHPKCDMWAALLLAVGAGLSTSIGSLLGLFIKRTSPPLVGLTLGFSAGAMILVSFVELLAGAVRIESVGFLGAHLAFFVGMGSYYLIDLLIPHDYIAQHDYPKGTHDLIDGQPPPPALHRTGLLVALGIGIHNFPEGMATFVGGLEDVNLGLAIAVAIAIHNVPEGLAISAPVYAATGSRKKAFLWSFLSGVSEIVGAALAAAILMPIQSERVLGFVLAAVGGIMVAISVDELIPVAKTLDTEHSPILGIIVGMMIMAFSLWMLR